MEKSKLYFAHPVNTYNTKWESATLDTIRIYFPNTIIENPNQPHHQKGYAEWKERYKNIPGKSGMDYFFDIVLSECNLGTVAMPFLDGKIGAGAAGEAIFTLKKNRGIWIIDVPDLQFIRTFTEKERELLLEWDKEKNKASDKQTLEKVENELVLGIKETRLRTWEILYQKLRFYEEAHLI